MSLARVFSPTPASRAAFAAAFFDADHGLAIEAADSPQAAIRDVDVVMCAARSRDESPVLLGEWLQPGMVVLSIGSTLPEQREVDVAAMARADADRRRHARGSRARDRRCAGRQPRRRRCGRQDRGLADVVGGQIAGAPLADDIVIYKSVGSALQDVVTAEMLLREALAGNRYELLPAGIVTIDR